MDHEFVHFDLVGKRAYVRSTDVLRAMLVRFPAKGLTLKFLRPLTGQAVLGDGQGQDGAVAVKTMGGSYVLSNAPDQVPGRISNRQASAATVRWRLAGWHIFLFLPTASIADRIERVFDIVHPKLGETFVVRSIQIISPRSAVAPLLWFRIHRAKAPDRANLTMRSPLGRLAEICFKLSPKRQSDQSIGSEIQRPGGSGTTSSAMVDADRPDLSVQSH